MEDVEPLYGSLIKVIQTKLKEKTKAKITLTATGKGETLHITANVTGLSKLSKSMRFRLVLAEEKIPYVANNGIRFHEMIVRKLPGGIKGIEFKEDKIEYRTDINLANFKTDLLEQLEVIEEGSKNEVFPIKPMSLKKLHLIGLVQDDKDGRVLQSAIIPVSGTLNYPDQKNSTCGSACRSCCPLEARNKTTPQKTSTQNNTPRKSKNSLKRETSQKETTRKEAANEEGISSNLLSYRLRTGSFSSNSNKRKEAKREAGR